MSNLNPIIEKSFLQYAGAVLQSRALVDVRDCIKPSARQIFYCLETDKFVHSKPFQKTLKAIGSAFRMYIHGDASAEGIIMRAGQPFSYRYPLVEVDGSYGTLLASGSWAAPRYTGARLSSLSEYLFKDMDKDTIDEWRDNYDDTEKYPSVLPSKGFFNLVNGSYGIGVGCSASIPQYNIKELNQALITLIKNPNASFEEIYCIPDFATGGTIINATQVKESHKNGSGFACKIRSTINWDAKDRCFVVTEIPYMVYTETICKQLEDIINSEDNFGIERFNDLTGQKPLIKIYLSKTANPDKVLKLLYKNTSLEDYYGINFTMLDNGRFPKLFTWKEILEAHIAHEKVVYRRGFEYDLRKINHRLHIIAGLLICCASIDEVVKLIKSSSSAAEASKALQTHFLLDEEQAKAVLDMKLSKLANLEVKKLENEKQSLETEAEKINNILSNEELFNQQLINGWEEVANKFGDARRTKVIDIAGEGDEVIEKKQISLSFTNKDAVYTTEVSTLYAQNRNTVGSKFKLDNGEYIVDTLIGDNTDTILFFTKQGKFYPCKMGEFNIGTKQYMTSILPITNDNIVAASVLKKNNNNEFVIFITKNGYIKKSLLSDYNIKKATGANALTLNEGDSIVNVLFMNEEEVGIATKKGNFIIIQTHDIRPIGRIARGVIGIKLNDGDYVISTNKITPSTKDIMSIAEDGSCKLTSLEEFKITGRGTKGKKIQNTDTLADFLPIDNTNDILVITTNAQLRLKISDIPHYSAGAIGTKCIKMTTLSKVKKILQL